MKIRARRALPAPVVVYALLATVTFGAPAMGAPRQGRRASPLVRTTATIASNSEKPPALPSLRWTLGRLPPGGALAEGGTAVVHAVSSGETWQSIAEAYLELTREYDARDLAKAIVDDNGPESKAGPTPGLRVRIPRMLEAAPKTGAAERIGLPRDGVVRGIYVRGSTAGSRKFPALLDRIVAHGMNAIVLDVKDYDGALTYPSKVELAVESGATDAAPIPSYARAVRFAHLRGVRVIARISCFSDQRMAKSHPSMAIRGVSGHPYRNGWLDPRNERAQAYVIDLVKEAIAAGVDEIQLDYVRFPVVGMKNIDFGVESHKDPNAKVKTITSFVERVHAITRAHGLPLSLDVFGVIAFGKQVDIQNLGQDPVELAKHSEFLSVMVYPSHYDPGFMGLDAPGDHPELVGMGVKHMREEMEERGLDLETSAKIRPWLQAMRHKSSNYGPGYIQHEIRSGEKAGASGWLLWNPGQVYDVAFRAVPRQPKVTKPPPLAPIKNR